MKFFNQWANAIINFDHRNGELGQSALGAGLYEVGYREDYATDVKITTLTGTQDTKQHGDDHTPEVEIVTYVLTEAFPIQIGDVSVAWNAENQFSTIPIQFTFRGYSLNQLPTGRTINPRGFSLSEWFGILGGAVNIGSQIYSNPPTSIGSALNLITNAKLFSRIF